MSETDEKERQSLPDDDDLLKTPKRVPSSQDLVGEELLASSRQLTPNQMDEVLSPFTPTETATPPSIHLRSLTSFSQLTEMDEGPSHNRVRTSNDLNKASTRPPRIPNQVAPALTQASHRVNNTDASNGSRGWTNTQTDVSLLSGLTDSSSETSHQLKKRTTSWDANDNSPPDGVITAHLNSTPLDILQPILPDAATPPISIFTKKNNENDLSQQKGKQLPQNIRPQSKVHIEHTSHTSSGMTGSNSDIAQSPLSIVNDGPKRFDLVDVMEAFPREGPVEARFMKKLEQLDRKNIRYHSVEKYSIEIEAAKTNIVLVRDLVELAMASKETSPEEEASNRLGIHALDSFEYSEAAGSHELESMYSSSCRLSEDEKAEILKLIREFENETFTNAGGAIIPGKIKRESLSELLHLLGDEDILASYFGGSSTRELCVENSRRLFDKLITLSNYNTLSLDILFGAARTAEKNIDTAKVKRIIQLFRPDSNGTVSKLDFVKSIDSIYKSVLFLNASIHNADQIVMVVGVVRTILFVFICCVLLILRRNNDTLLWLIITLLATMAFMVGSSKFFEGVSFVLVRQPYEIGDRIDIQSQGLLLTDPNGWIVEKFNLFSTTLRSGTTFELCTISNSMLAETIVTNKKRSEISCVSFTLKFGLDTSKEKLMQFHKNLIKLVEDRRLEWNRLKDFRCTRVEGDLGFIEYAVILQHRYSWQNYSAIMDSKSAIMLECLELQRQMHIKHTSSAD